MVDPNIHIGEIYGIYEIIGILPDRDKRNRAIYKGKCLKCGYEKIGAFGEFSAPSKIASVCNHKRANGDPIPYGHKWNNKRIGNIFKGMARRCYNKNDKSYRWYGEKGIKICEEWLNNPKSFEQWAMENGYNDKLTIDRKYEDQDYCPENCQWVTGNANAKYKSTTRMIDVDGESHTGREWADILGIGTNIINTYIREYGEKNTKEFIRRYLKRPYKEPKGRQSYYDLYMNNDDISF